MVDLRLTEASRRTGLASKTLRNLAAKQRAGLPTGYPYLKFRKRGRLLVVRESDLAAWLQAQDESNTTPDENLRATLETIAGQIAGIFPEQAQALRNVAMRSSLQLVDNEVSK